VALLTNNFDGGTPGTTITTGNSGGVSGTAWTTVNSTAGGTIEYTTVQTHGGLAMRINSGSAAAAFRVRWTQNHGDRLRAGVLLHGRAGPYHVEHAAARLDDHCRHGRLTNHVAGRRQQGEIHTSASSAAVGGVSTTVLPVDQWIRLEWQLTPGAGTGSITFKIFASDAESTTPDETISLSSQQFGADIGGFYVGTNTARPTRPASAATCTPMTSCTARRRSPARRRPDRQARAPRHVLAAAQPVRLVLMLLLTSTSDLLQVVTGSTGTIHVHASWVDLASGDRDSGPDEHADDFDRHDDDGRCVACRIDDPHRPGALHLQPARLDVADRHVAAHGRHDDDGPVERHPRAR
jgi:hypothetical protein